MSVTARPHLQPAVQGTAACALSTKHVVLVLATGCKSVSPTLAEFLYNLTLLSLAGNPHTQYTVCAWPRRPVADMGMEPGWEGTGNPARETGYSRSTAELRSSRK